MQPSSKPSYRRLRNGGGLALAALWIAYRWLTLKAQHDAAVAGLGHCAGFWQSVGCEASHAGADGGYAGGVFLAILVSPLALVIAHYAARWKVEYDEAEAARVQQEREAARLATQRQESDARIAEMERQAQRAHRNVERSDFIHKLGAVSDFLDLLAAETDPNRIANIRLGVAQALRDLVAKHTTAQLSAIIRADDAITVSLTAILGRLNAASFDTSGEVQILRAALFDADTSLHADQM